MRVLAKHAGDECSNSRYGRHIMLFKGDSRAFQYRSHIVGHLLGISFMTLAELERWSLERNWGAARKTALVQHLTNYTVLPVSRELCVKWAQVSFEARRKGRPIQTADAWIAASALYYDVPLITNNAIDYRMIDGLHILTAV